MEKEGKRYFQKKLGLIFLECPMCAKRNKHSLKRGRFIIYATSENLIIVCPYCGTRQYYATDLICPICETKIQTGATIKNG